MGGHLAGIASKRPSPAAVTRQRLGAWVGGRLYDRRPMQSRLATLLAVVAVAGCSATPSSPPPTPTAAPTPTSAPTVVAPSPTPADPATVYALVASQVEAIRGLQPTKAVAPVLLDQAQLTKNLIADYDKANPAAAVAISERELIALGLIPEGSSMRALVLDLQSGQVAGYYSTEDKQLFVVSRAGGVGPTQRLTYAHEFTHQLQDQTFDLDSIEVQAPDQGDRWLAWLALVEGDAVSVQTTWMVTELTADDLGQVTQDALDPAGLAAFSRAPKILQETAFFPYQAGAAFVAGLITNGNYDAVNAAYADPPPSTEQVIHPEKYVARELPIVVKPASTLASKLGSGWSELARDTLGELTLRVWLNTGGVSSADASTAAAGWGGDRLVLFSGPGGATAIAIETAWDTAADAAEFEAAATRALAGHGLASLIVHTAGSTRVSIAIGLDITQLAAALPG